VNVREKKLCTLWAKTTTKYLPIKLLDWVHKTIRYECQNGALATSLYKIQFEDEPVNKLLKRKPAEGIILFHDSFFDEPYKKQEFIVLHEIAHFVLKHHGIDGKIHDQKEKEADELANKWINDHNRKNKAKP
jgi:hypothetical protein